MILYAGLVAALPARAQLAPSETRPTGAHARRSRRKFRGLLGGGNLSVRASQS